MQNESEPEKKLKIRPRGMSEKDKEPPSAKEPPETQPDTPERKKLKWDNRLRQSGVKFQPKPAPKSLGSPVEAAEAKNPAPTTSPRQDPESEDPQNRPEALQPEGWESSFSPSPAPDNEAESPGGERRQTRETAPIIRRRGKRRVRLIYALAAAVAAVVFFSVVSWNLGVVAGVQSSLDAETKEKATVPKEFLAKLDQGLADLRTGNSDKAKKRLQELERSNPDVASLTYLLAVAAVQSGDFPLAQAKTAESISKRERISDSLAIQAVLETRKAFDPTIQKFGDPRIRSESLLRQAMLADAANPFPMIELATLLRSQKRTGEALALLRGARSRLNPVDSHSVVDATIGLATLQDTPDSGLPQVADPGKDLPSAFSAAYIAMRKGDFDQAAGIAKTARKMSSPDLFDYLIHDPAFQPYSGEQKLREFFQ